MEEFLFDKLAGLCDDLVADALFFWARGVEQLLFGRIFDADQALGGLVVRALSHEVVHGVRGSHNEAL